MVVALQEAGLKAGLRATVMNGGSLVGGQVGWDIISDSWGEAE